MKAKIASGHEKSGQTAGLLERYTEAWSSRDIDRIMALHTMSTVFQLHDGSSIFRGASAVRAAFATTLAAYPDLWFEPVDVILGENHATMQSIMHATVSGARRTVDAVDVLRFVDGLVDRKDTYLDTARQQAFACGD